MTIIYIYQFQIYLIILLYFYIYYLTILLFKNTIIIHISSLYFIFNYYFYQNCFNIVIHCSLLSINFIYTLNFSLI